MKNIIFAIFIFKTIFVSSQEIKYDENYKLPEYIVVDVNGSENDLYKKAFEWISKTYKNPKEVITSNIENELLKINGACVGCLVMNIMGSKHKNTLKYIITLEFKPNKYKFELSSVTFENADYLKDGKSLMLKKNGKIRGPFKNYPTAIEKELNYIFDSLKNYMTSTEEDW